MPQEGELLTCPICGAALVVRRVRAKLLNIYIVRLECPKDASHCGRPVRMSPVWEKEMPEEPSEEPCQDPSESS